MRVFVSSTCYDLIDVRAHVGALLRSLDAVPVMSDDQLSDFHVKHSASSIESCLVNVDSSDEVIVILDQRYGPRLGKYGFEDVSATHLEYKRAITKKLPVHVYVRDRLEADYRVWSKNGKRTDLDLPWVKQQHDFGLFNLIEEHGALSANAETSNWYRSFSTVTDLSGSIRHLLERRVTPARLTKAINANMFPILDIEQSVQRLDVLPGHMKVEAILRNVGGSPGFNLCAHWEDIPTNVHRRAIIPPDGRFKVFHLIDSALAGESVRVLGVTYDNPIGVCVEDRFELKVIVGDKHEVVVSTQLLDRKFRHCDEVCVAISD
jgi:hypothetical protein